MTLVYCGQTVTWTKTKLGTEVDLGPGHNVLAGDTQPSPFPPAKKWTQTPIFTAHVYCGQTATLLEIFLVNKRESSGSKVAGTFTRGSVK